MAHCLNGHTFFAQYHIWGGVWFPHVTVWAAFVTCWLATEQKRPWVSAGCMESSLARSLKHPLCIPSHHRAVRSPGHVRKTREGLWSKPPLSPACKSLQPRWHLSEDASRWPQPLAIWVFQAEAPDSVEQRHDIPAVPWGICERNKMLVVSPTKRRGWLERQQTNWKTSANPKPI